MPSFKTAQTFPSTKGLILNDSWPFNISTVNLLFLFKVNFALTNLVKFFFFSKLFFNVAKKGFSNLRPKIFCRYGNTKNLKQAAEDIGLPGSPKKDLFLFF